MRRLLTEAIHQVRKTGHTRLTHHPDGAFNSMYIKGQKHVRWSHRAILSPEKRRTIARLVIGNKRLHTAFVLRE